MKKMKKIIKTKTKDQLLEENKKLLKILDEYLGTIKHHEYMYQAENFIKIQLIHQELKKEINNQNK